MKTLVVEKVFEVLSRFRITCLVCMGLVAFLVLSVNDNDVFPLEIIPLLILSLNSMSENVLGHYKKHSSYCNLCSVF